MRLNLTALQGEMVRPALQAAEAAGGTLFGQVIIASYDPKEPDADSKRIVFSYERLSAAAGKKIKKIVDADFAAREGRGQ